MNIKKTNYIAYLRHKNPKLTYSQAEDKTDDMLEWIYNNFKKKPVVLPKYNYGYVTTTS